MVLMMWKVGWGEVQYQFSKREFSHAFHASSTFTTFYIKFVYFMFYPDSEENQVSPSTTSGPGAVSYTHLRAHET